MASSRKSRSPRSANGAAPAPRPSDGARALEDRVAQVLDAHVPRGSGLTVGLSGGLDSVVLLDLVVRWAGRTADVNQRNEVRALHVHHGLSPNADSWAAFCALFARRRAVPIRVAGVRVDRQGRGLEAAARAARYAEYAKIETPFLLLAHHQDDQAETVLLQMVRGAGLEGLSAMPVARALREGSAAVPVVLRPLLAVDRATIRRYARARRLRWIEDESNDDLRYARNFVRHRVMTELEALAPGVAERLARSAAHMAQAAEIVRERAAEDARNVIAQGWSIESLQALGVARAMHALREMLRGAGAATPSVAQLDQLWAQLTGARRDARVEVRLTDATVRRYRDRIDVTIHRAATPPVPALEAGTGGDAVWDGTEPWTVPGLGGVLTFEPGAPGEGIDPRFLVSPAVSLRLRRGGERFLPTRGGRHRSLKNLFQERGIAPWERSGAPLLFISEQLAWVAGLGVAAPFCVAADEVGRCPAWHPF